MLKKYILEKSEVEIFSGKKNLREFASISRCSLKEILKRVLQIEGK